MHDGRLKAGASQSGFLLGQLEAHIEECNSL
jgi:hypothetical protein